MPEEIMLDNKPVTEDLDGFLQEEFEDHEEKEVKEEPKEEPKAETEEDDSEEDLPKSLGKQEEPEDKETESLSNPEELENKPPESVGIRNLRNQYKKVKSEAENLRKQLEELKSRPAVDETVLTELEQAKAKLAAVDFTESEDYKKLNKQANTAFERGKESALTYAVENDEGESRNVTAEEWESFVFSKDGQAGKMAKTLFGDSASIMLGQRQKVRDAMEEAAIAKKEHQENWKKLQEKGRIETEQRQARLLKATQNAISAQIEAFPDYYGIEPDDDTRDALEKGERLAQLALGGAGDLDDGGKARLYASTFLRIKNFPALALKNKKLGDEIQSLKSELEKLKSGSPKGGTKPTAKTKEPKSYEDEIRSLAEELT